MPVQPYDNCPCGSGKKFRFCCQKLAKYAERAEELLEKGQVAGAMQAVADGLAVEPQSMWLRTLKLQMLLSAHDHDAATALIAEMLQSKPGYRPALLLRLQHELAHALMEDAVGTMQEILDAASADELPETYAWMEVLGQSLAEIGLLFAALAHLRFATAAESASAEAKHALETLQGNAAESPWLRDTYELRPAPEGISTERWANAIALAGKGRWQRAKAIFDMIATQKPETAAVWFNLGLCHGWLARSEDAAQSLERYAALEPNADRAVDALALAQCLDPRESEQTVDVIQVHYRVRDHSRLLQKLKDHPRFQVHALDAHEDELGEGVKDEFYLLDKDSVENARTLTMEDLPAIVGVLRTRGTELELQFADPAADDPRPSTILEAAGDTIEPDGKRSVVGEIPLSTHRLRRMWGLPARSSPPDLWRVQQMVHNQSYREVWPETPLGWLNNRTPCEASQVPEFKLPLRAAVLISEYSCEVHLFDIDMDELRRRLGLDPEPWFDGGAEEIARLPLARLRYVRAESLPTPVLRSLFDRAHLFSLPLATERSAAALVARPADHDQFDSIAAFHSLIELAKRRANRPAALNWLDHARRFDAATGGPSDRAIWDIAEWEISFLLDTTREWAPRLAQLARKLEKDQEASRDLMFTLVRTGIVRLVPHPSEPNRMVMDARLLEQILTRFATPQTMLDLTPVGGQPGKIWTPADQSAGGDSPIVLPGQESAAKPRSKLVIPGS